jgi:nucleoside-diphosphate-sugar epimerase
LLFAELFMSPQQTEQILPRHLVIGFEHPFAIELSRALQLGYGPDQVEGTKDTGTLPSYLERWRPTDVYLLTSIFATAGPEHPAAQWHRSTRELLKVLNLARHYGFKLFYPSSIAVFGSSAPATNCDDNAPQEPQSYFGLSKRAAERWCEHYFLQYDLDIRSLRFPVIIRPSAHKRSHPANTTAAMQARPVLHINDAVRATVELMAAPASSIRSRHGYNLAGTSLSLRELATELGSESSSPGLEYWNLPEYPGPTSLDDTAARNDWGWKPAYELVQLIGSFCRRDSFFPT